MDRREFLRLGGLVAIPVAVPLLGSCTTTSKPKAQAPATDPTTASFPAGSLQALVDAKAGSVEIGDAQGENLVNAGRVAFGIVKDNKPVTDAAVTVYIGQDAGKPPVATAPASWIQGEMAAKALYVTDVSFPRAGDWLVGVSVHAKDGKVYGGGMPVTVVAKSTSPGPGQPATSVPTPTVVNPLGADPLCSDVPPCPMHTVSLDAALRSGKPTVLVFAAPAYCQTETCGPVVHIIKAAMPPYADRVNFVHVEAYDKDSVGTPQPPMVAWKLTTEPFTFFIDAKGVVTGRLPGAFGAEEFGTKLRALAT